MQGKPKPVRAHEREVGKGEKMKSIIISIQPKWCAKIESGAKTIEVRKTRPKIETPFKCYIYESKGKTKYWSQPMPIPYREGGGKVIGEFVCDRIDEFYLPYPAYFHRVSTETKDLIKKAYLTMLGAHHYIGTDSGYAWRITDLKIYDKPKELGEFKKPCAADENCYLCEKSGFTPDMLLDCFNFLTRPPQSWCYVEELEE